MVEAKDKTQGNTKGQGEKMRKTLKKIAQQLLLLLPLRFCFLSAEKSKFLLFSASKYSLLPLFVSLFPFYMRIQLG